MRSIKTGVIGAVLAAGLMAGAAFGHVSAQAPPPVTEAQAKAIFYELLAQRTAAVEQKDLSKILPLYAHDAGLLVLRHEVALRGWPAVEAYWTKSMSGPPRAVPFRVHWNDDLMVVVHGDVIVGGLTWSNQLGDEPPHYGCLSLALERRGTRWVIVNEHSANWTKPATVAG